MKSHTRIVVTVSMATLVWLTVLLPADAAQRAIGTDGTSLADGVAPPWPIPTDIPPGPPPMPVMPAAGPDAPPVEAITDPLTPGAACGGWIRQQRYADAWETAMTWWEFDCAGGDVTYHNTCTSTACDAWCPFCSTETRTWTDRFVWDGSAPAFYGADYMDDVVYENGWESVNLAWWDVANLLWYDRNRYPLDVYKPGDGAGTVTSAPAGIDCGATCGMLVDAGGSVTLTATAGLSSVFTGWSAAECPGVGPCVLPIGHGRWVNATFVATSFELTVAKSGNGSGRVVSSPSGIDCGTVCAAAFAPGTVATLGAAPNTGSLFTGWSGACSGQGSCQVTLDRDRAVTASFVPIAHRADAMIRAGVAGDWVGDDVYSVTGAGESVSISAARGTTAVFEVQVQNDGNVPDILAIVGAAGTGDITVRYADAVGDITPAVIQGTYRTDAIPPGASRKLTVTLTIAHRTRAGTQLSIPLTVAAGGSSDRVVATVSVASR